MPSTKFPAQFDVANLNGIDGFSIMGLKVNDYFGQSVSGAGDVNADGIEDIIIGAANISPKYGADISYVLFGNSTLGSNGFLNLDILNGNNGFQIQGIIKDDDKFGYSVSSAGDINHDGISDIAIGAICGNPDSSRSCAGITYIIFGHPNIGAGGSFNITTLDGTNGFQIYGIVANENSGVSVNKLDDINGDGLTDLIIGAYHQNGAVGDYSGCSYVVFGNTNIGATGILDLTNLNGTNGFKIPGISAGDQMGYPVSKAGDVNNDGLADIIIGGRAAQVDTLSGAGKAWVIFGDQHIGTNGTVDLINLDGKNGFQIPGFEKDAELGAAVSYAGDVNNDGIADILIGAPYTNYNDIISTGVSYILFGNKNIGGGGQFDLLKLTENEGIKIPGLSEEYRLGYSLSNAGDINHDNITDILIGANNGDGYLIFGNSSIGIDGFVDLTLIDGVNGFKILGAIALAVNKIGDVNHDNIDDFIIGYCDLSTKGSSYILFGDTPFSYDFIANSLTIKAEQTVTFNESNLAVTYTIPPRAAVQPFFIINNLQHGKFTYTNDTATAITQFTEQDIAQGKIQFIHDGSELAPTYNVTMSSLGLANYPPPAEAANINFVNQLPIFINNTLTINQGETILITNNFLSATDPDRPQEDGEILFTISNLKRGLFVNTEFQSVNTFYQSEIQANNISFVHDNSANPPVYQVSLYKGDVTIGPKAATIDFTYRPILMKNNLQVNQGKSVILTINNLYAVDPGGDSNQLLFIVKYLQNGKFTHINSNGSMIDNFTQQEIEDGIIQFNDLDVPSRPSFSVVVSNGKITTAVNDSLITFNYKPHFVYNGFTVNEGESVILTKDDLYATHRGTPDQDILFLASNIKYGYFEAVENPGIRIVEFLQQRIIDKTLKFFTDGTPHTPQYNITVLDNVFNTSSSAKIKFIPNDSNNEANDKLLINVMISGITAIAVGLISLGAWLVLSRQASKQMKQMSQAYRGEHPEYLLPIAEQIFKDIKFSSCLGYISDQTMQDYMNAIIVLTQSLINVNTDLNSLGSNENHSERQALLKDISAQTRRRLNLDNRSCYSLRSCMTLFAPEISQARIQEIATHANDIAQAVKDNNLARDQLLEIHEQQTAISVEGDLKTPLLGGR